MTIYTDNNLIDGMTCLYRITATDSLGVSTSVVVDPANMPGHSITAEGTGGTDITYQVTLVDVGGNVDYEVYIDSEFVGSATNIATPDVRDPVTFTLTPSPGVTTFLVSLWVAPTGGTHTLQQIVEVTLADPLPDFAIAAIQADPKDRQYDQGYGEYGWDGRADLSWYSPSGYFDSGVTGPRLDIEYITQYTTYNRSITDPNSFRYLAMTDEGQETLMHNISVVEWISDESPELTTDTFHVVLRVYHPETDALLATYDTRTESHRIMFYKLILDQDTGAGTTTLDASYQTSGPNYYTYDKLPTWYEWTKNGTAITSLAREYFTAGTAAEITVSGTMDASGLIAGNQYGMNVYLDDAGTQFLGSFEYPSETYMYAVSIDQFIVTQDGGVITAQARVINTPAIPFHFHFYADTTVLDGDSGINYDYGPEASGTTISQTKALGVGTYSISLSIYRDIFRQELIHTHNYGDFTVT